MTNGIVGMYLLHGRCLTQIKLYLSKFIYNKSLQDSIFQIYAILCIYASYFMTYKCVKLFHIVLLWELSH